MIIDPPPKLPVVRRRTSDDVCGDLTAIFLILIVGILVDLVIFRSVERRALAARGLTGVKG